MKKTKLRKVKPKRKKKTRAQQRGPNPHAKIRERADGFSYDVLSSPFKDMSDDERANLVKDMGTRANEKYQETVTKLKEVASQHYPISLLSILAAYGTMGGLKDDGTLKPILGNDMGQAHVELMQALCLTVPLSDNQHNLQNPQAVEDIFEALNDVSLSFSFKRMSDVDLKWTEEERAIRHVQEHVRQRTQIVRNWGYYNQVIRILREVFSPLDDRYQKSFGFTATNALDFFAFLVETTEQRLNKRNFELAKLIGIKKPSELIYLYHESLGLEKEKAEEFITNLEVEKRDIKEVFSMVLSHSDFLLDENYTHNTQELSKNLKLDEKVILNIFEAFSYKFGDLKDESIEHIFLANPIWKRPLIRISEDKIFCPLPQVFFSFALTSLDALLCSTDTETSQSGSEALSNHRSKYLEEKIEQIVKTRFPEAQTLVGLKWKLDNVEYETDLLTFIDSQIVIIEAKSGKISDTALRGAPKRLKHDLDELLLQPNIQSQRLKTLLLELIANASLDHPIRKKLPVDLAKIHKIHRISVSLEDFASIQSNLKHIADTGWLPKEFEPCPTMCLADFETIFDILEHPVQIIHYMQRREILERNVKYLGDELDLLGWYIETLFNLPDFGEEFTNIVVSGSSSIIDKYYIGRDNGLMVNKPKPKLHQLFEDILKQLEERQTERWTEIGVILHMFMPNDQKKLVSLLPQLRKKVEKNRQLKGHENMLILNPASPSEIALCYIYFNDENVSQRYDFVDSGSTQALEPSHVKFCLIIAKNIDDDIRAYDFIALAGRDKKL